MRRLGAKIAVLGISACLVLGPVAPVMAGTTPPNTATSLTIKAPKKVPKGKKFSITGNLKSSTNLCKANLPVRLLKKNSVIATKNTSASGAYKFRVKMKKKATYRVQFAGQSVGTHPNWANCLASQSAKKTVRLKK